MGWKKTLPAVLGTAMVASAIGAFTPTFAQSVSIESEWKKLLRVNEEIQPLGPNALGESVSLYDGSVSFRQVDLDARGNGLPIVVERTLRARPSGGPNAYVFDLASQAFGDWDMTVPQMETLSAESKFTDADGHDTSEWYFLENAQRCSRFGGAGAVDVPTKPGEEGVTWEPGQWWHGIQLKIPGAGSQDVLRRDPANNNVPQMSLEDGTPIDFVAVTKQNWALGCISTPDIGETFVAVSPEGTRYWLDRLSWRPYSSLAHPGGGALKRRLVLLQASRAEDRFGRTLTFGYDANNRLASVSADDGRSVSFVYESWQHSAGIYPVGERMTSMTQHGANGERTWTYTYGGTADEPELSAVTLPDQSSWQFSNLLALSIGSGHQQDVNYDGCLYSYTPQNPTDTAAVTHPSGLRGEFTMQPVLRGRSNVPYRCILDRGVQIIQIPHTFVASSIVQKHYTGTGIDQAWQFAYSPSNQSWTPNAPRAARRRSGPRRPTPTEAGCAIPSRTSGVRPKPSCFRRTRTRRRRRTPCAPMSPSTPRAPPGPGRTGWETICRA